MKTILATTLALTFAAPVAAQTAADIVGMDEAARQTVLKAAAEETLACWARGMDLTLEGKAEEALTAWTDCYAHPDYAFRVLFNGQTIEGEGAAGRAETNVRTGGMFGYTGAYHFVSNVEVERTGDDTATATALQTADHFREDGTVERTYGVITVELAQVAEGVWRATDELMDIHRMIGVGTRPAPAAMVQQ